MRLTEEARLIDYRCLERVRAHTEDAFKPSPYEPGGSTRAVVKLYHRTQLHSHGSNSRPLVKLGEIPTISPICSVVYTIVAFI